MRLAVIAVLLVLVGCGGTPRAPVEDRSAGSARSSTSSSNGYYHVQKGDTLYSIAFRYGLDFKRLAAANGISSNYTIYPGQRLVLREASTSAQRNTTKPATTSTTASTTTAKPKPAPTQTASTTSPKPSAPTTSTSSATKPKPTPAPKPTKPDPTGSAMPKWRWPTKGSVTRRYSATVHKGIDISGRRGDAIYAVADGKVVYAGTGIVGLGELLIIKHNDVYLSAYAHNDKLLVREGQLIKAGQKIAAKGSSGTDTIKLHFEIRKNGKPVDPLRLLPRR